MVHTTSAIAVAVLALNAASTLARPLTYEGDLEVRDYDYELDARQVESYDFDAREFEDSFEVDARDFEFGDYEYESRDLDIMDEAMEILERATATTSTSSKPSTTTSTHVSKPTGKNKKETKTVVITVQKQADKCKKPSLLSKIKNALKKKKVTSTEKHSLMRHLEIKRIERKARVRAEAKAEAKYAAKAGVTPTPTTSTTGTAKATSTAASTTKTADWSAITAPPAPKGVKVNQKKKIGKDKVTTILRTVTAAPTPCATSASKKSKRDFEDVEDILEREYSFDELD